MINGLLEFIERHRTAVLAIIILFALLDIVAIAWYMSLPGSTPSPTPVPSAMPTITATPVPTAEPTVEPAPVPTAEPSPTPTPVPTVTPDLDIQASITPLDQYAPNYMVNVQKSTTTGALSIDLSRSDIGGQYAYLNDTYVTRLMLADISNATVDRIWIHVTCRNDSGTGYTLYESERVDLVMLKPGDKIYRSVGFKVDPATPPGKYLLHVDIYTDPYGNESWTGYGCGLETGLNILRLPG